MSEAAVRVYRGTVVHATQTEPMSILPDHVLGVQRGKVAFLSPAAELPSLRERFEWDDRDTVQLLPSELLMPGLVDTHIHAPQYMNAGLGLDLPLLEWLNKYTYPVETRFCDLAVAQDVYSRVVRRCLINGTTTACYFATLHLEATLALADIVETAGQRAYIGKVCMDQQAPPSYIEDTAQSLRDTETFIQAVHSKACARITPVVTPRFALSCSEQLLRGLGQVARTYGVPVQSHISESRAECEAVRRMYRQCDTYADVYAQAGLLAPRTVMAHGVHLSAGELAQFARCGAGISHCPNSNTNLLSGVLDARGVLGQGVKLGLGTDVSGGYSTSILHAMRHSVLASKTCAIQRHDVTRKFGDGPAPTNCNDVNNTCNGVSHDDNHDVSRDVNHAAYTPLTMSEAFRLATLGGAQVLGLDDQIGNFLVGKEFDALRIDTRARGSSFDVFDDDTTHDAVCRFLHLGDDRNILEVHVSGQQVKPTSDA